jgi:23S rRNA (pseudouridine1915-N3)-methyltransferase
MRLLIAGVGRARTAPEQVLAELYCERARGLGTRLGFTAMDLAIVEVSRAHLMEARRTEEAQRLEPRLPPQAHRVALDETGRPQASEAFARHLAHLRDSGTRDVVFLIGGPDGLQPELKAKAQEKLALGPQTWPHLLVRAMLAEQIYRAMTILAGHPYHRGDAGKDSGKGAA